MCDHLSYKETTSHKANRSSRPKVSLRHRRNLTLVKSRIKYVCDEGYAKVISPEIFGQVARNFWSSRSKFYGKKQAG